MEIDKAIDTKYFCTLFDSNYLLKGLAMVRSLVANCPAAKIFVLCMDSKTESILEKLNLPFVNCISLADIEDEGLLVAKASRGVAEYCWTLSPCLPWYLMSRHREIDFITYLDADLYFYSNIAPLFDEIGNASIAIIEHRFPDRLKDREVNGLFCVEWVSFRRDDEGMACLSRWREQCIEWCYYRLEDGKMGDQKYLDEWPSQYSSCHILKHFGAGLAPWNYEQYKFDMDDKDEITVQGAPLIFYHFHQFQLLDNGKYDRLSTFYTANCPEPAKVYEVYESALESCLEDVRSIESEFKSGLKSVSSVRGRRILQSYVPMWAKEFLRKFLRY
jgi:hypothetical protein